MLIMNRDIEKYASSIKEVLVVSVSRKQWELLSALRAVISVVLRTPLFEELEQAGLNLRHLLELNQAFHGLAYGI